MMPDWRSAAAGTALLPQRSDLDLAAHDERCLDPRPQRILELNCRLADSGIVSQPLTPWAPKAIDTQFHDQAAF